jgi:MoxR-like ATPase
VKDPSVADPREALVAVRAEVAKVVVGHDDVVTAVLAALLLGGHVLLEGVPGTAKTLLAKALGAALDLDVSRVQFTPDLMPTDVSGNLVLEGSKLVFRPGPVFCNILLADEINRTPPKTQAALLEAMEERQVTMHGKAHPLPLPFVVMATQNPVEYEGTYPLPEAQLDRFLFKVPVGYPDEEREREVVRRHHHGLDPHDLAGSGVTAVAGAAEIEAGAAAVAGVDVEEPVLAYVVSLARATRESPSLSLGVSPRGSTALLKAAKAAAWLEGSEFVTPDHVKLVARLVFRHRVIVRPEVELEGTSADGVLDGILAAVPVPR